MSSDISIRSEQRPDGRRDGWLPSADDALRRFPALVIAGSFLLSFLVNAAASGQNLVHPFIFMDDLIWEIAKGIYYSLKLPAEGRWLVFAWNDLLGVWPAAASYGVALAAWSLAAAVIGHLLAPQEPLKAILAGAALASCPAMLNVLMWPHTALPIFAVFAVAMTMIWLLRGFRRARLLAIFLASAAASLSYQTLALLIMAVVVTCVVLSELRGGGDLKQMVVRMIAPSLACALGATAGLIIAFALNFHAFGHFGFVIEPWRVGVGHQDRSRAVIALRNMAGTAWFLTRQTFGVAPALLVITLGALGLSARGAPGRVARARFFALCVLLTICGATWLVVFLTRAPTEPERSGALVWFAIIGAALALGAAKPRAKLTYASLVVLLVTGVVTGAAPFAGLARVQARNDDVVAKVAADLGREEKAPAQAVYVVGSSSVLLNAKGEPMQEWWVSNLLDRAAVRQPLAVRPIYCSGSYNAAACGAVRRASVRDGIAHMPSYPAAGYLGRSGDMIIVKLGPVD